MHGEAAFAALPQSPNTQNMKVIKLHIIILNMFIAKFLLLMFSKFWFADYIVQDANMGIGNLDAGTPFHTPQGGEDEPTTFTAEATPPPKYFFNTRID